MARPKLEMDEGLIERLAMIHCPTSEIAAALNCSTDTLERRYAALLAKGRDKGRLTLRRTQWESAMKGNVVMMIWLGKQLLKQSDKMQQTMNVELAKKAEEYEALPVQEQILLMEAELKRLKGE